MYLCLYFYMCICACIFICVFLPIFLYRYLCLYLYMYLERNKKKKKARGCWKIGSFAADGASRIEGFGRLAATTGAHKSKTWTLTSSSHKYRHKYKCKYKYKFKYKFKYKYKCKYKCKYKYKSKYNWLRPPAHIIKVKPEQTKLTSSSSSFQEISGFLCLNIEQGHLGLRVRSDLVYWDAWVAWVAWAAWAAFSCNWYYMYEVLVMHWF